MPEPKKKAAKATKKVHRVGPPVESLGNPMVQPLKNRGENIWENSIVVVVESFRKNGEDTGLEFDMGLKFSNPIPSSQWFRRPSPPPMGGEGCLRQLKLRLSAQEVGQFSRR